MVEKLSFEIERARLTLSFLAKAKEVHPRFPLFYNAYEDKG